MAAYICTELGRALTMALVLRACVGQPFIAASDSTSRFLQSLPPSVVPLPVSYKFLQGSVADILLSASNKDSDKPFTFQLATGSATSDVLARALARFTALLTTPFEHHPTGITFPYYGASESDRRKTASSSSPETNRSSFPFTHTLDTCAVYIDSASTALHQDTNESYTLLVHQSHNKQPSCLITAPNVYGAMYGMETFTQLVENHNHQSGSGRTVPAIFVKDEPRFSFRATMIDTARHWLPVDDVILPHIDAMAACKMNVLHWHIVDSQSWPYVSVRFPQLSAHGAFHSREVYTPADIRRVIAYAKDRGIRVMPEIDTPGHVWAGLAAIPAVLTTCYDDHGVSIGTGPMDPTKESTFDFLATLLAEVVPLFGSDMFMMGGDEVDYSCWQSNPDVIQFMQEKGWGSDMGKLENYYNRRLLEILTAHNTSSIMCWEELFHNREENHLPKDTAIVNVWQGGWEWCSRTTSSSTVDRTNSSCARDYGNGGPWFGKKHVRDNSWTHTMGKAAVAGYRTVLSSPFYLNVQAAGSNFDESWPFYYAIEPTDFDASWADWNNNVFPAENEGRRSRSLTADEREASVLGVEACMWTEWTNRDNFGPRFWPATAAVAERGWSSKHTTSIDEFRRRLFRFACTLHMRGLAAAPVVFGGSFFHKNGTVCRAKGGVLGPPAPGCRLRFSSCASV